MRSFSIASAILFLGAHHAHAELKSPSTALFQQYWNQGQAEISSYQLHQARYGEVHQGHAVLIYVTEPFSKKKQVKLDNPDNAGADHIPVLKLNATRKFNTGIYPYSMMTSIFSPAVGGPSLKVTATSQEWCGHTFMQLNRRGSGYEGQLFSYFESEGDQKLSVGGTELEDSIWTTIRTRPSALPTGSIKIVPGTTHLRLRHLPVRQEKATATLTKQGKRWRYHLQYQSIDRSLTIEFDAQFPHQIQSWTERYQSGWGPKAKTLETKATLNKTLMSDYWRRHGNIDRKLRSQLGLPEN